MRAYFHAKWRLLVVYYYYYEYYHNITRVFLNHYFLPIFVDLIEFTDEEGYGKYLDLHEVYDKFLNLRGIEVRIRLIKLWLTLPNTSMPNAVERSQSYLNVLSELHAQVEVTATTYLSNNIILEWLHGLWPLSSFLALKWNTDNITIEFMIAGINMSYYY